MGFDIIALDDQGNDVAYLRAANRTFRMISEQGYDWFELLDANDCYGGVSGTGESKMIPLARIQGALDALLSHDAKGRLGSIDPLQSSLVGAQLQAIMQQAPDTSTGADNFVNTFMDFKPDLQRFMQACVDWCTAHSKKEMEILFE